jgi:hypothetical protein
MSDITIKVLDVSEASQPAGKTYKQLTVSYTDIASGKTEGKKVMDFVSQDVFNTLLGASNGSVYTVGRVKVNGYWNWTSIKVADAAAAKQVMSPASSAPTAARSSTSTAKPERVGSWETPDERSAKQVYIVRQSSISAAIALLAAEGPGINIDADEVIALAKKFESYVFADGIAGLVSDDLPE